MSFKIKSLCGFFHKTYLGVKILCGKVRLVVHAMTGRQAPVEIKLIPRSKWLGSACARLALHGSCTYCTIAFREREGKKHTCEYLSVKEFLLMVLAVSKYHAIISLVQTSTTGFHKRINILLNNIPFLKINVDSISVNKICVDNRDSTL